ncbi:transposase family protein [Anaerovirgula multivorans]|uniref:transposase family protein n=1 Tax=Anaerovirgula multivorans TaxID=312168 RepID=UPI000B782A39
MAHLKFLQNLHLILLNVLIVDITYTVHDRRYQSYQHLPIWAMDTVIILEKKRYVCSCSPEKPF